MLRCLSDITSFLTQTLTKRGGGYGCSPPARVICLAPALTRPKRLDYTSSPVRKQAGNQDLRVVPLGVGGPPAGISFSGGLAETAGITETAGMVIGVAYELGHWPVRSHWDNGRLARCVGGLLAVHATRKMRVVPVSGGSLGEGGTCDPTMRSQRVAILPVSGRTAAR